MAAARVSYGLKNPRTLRLPAFDELVLRDIVHVEAMGGGVWCIIVGDGGGKGPRLHLSVSKGRITVVEENGVLR